jgi:hypothetical protein
MSQAKAKGPGMHLNRKSILFPAIQRPKSRLFSLKLTAILYRRRYFMGAYTKLKRTYESLIHYTNGPVTLNLNCGPFRYHQMGVCTLYRYLQESPPNSREVRILQT